MKTCSVTCFGVGDGFPCADRHHASFMYQMGKASVLVDCGESIDRSFQAREVSYDLMDVIFLSHLHADHFAGFFMLMQGCWLKGRRKDLPVYLPRNAIKPLRQMFRAAFLFEELLKFRLRFNPLAAGKAVRVRDVRITAFATSHLDRVRRSIPKKYRGIFASYCFLLEAGRVRAGHSADLGKPGDLDPLVAEPLDLLVCELAHFTPEEIFAYLRGKPVKQVAFVHLGRAYWDDLPRLRRLAARMLPDLPHTFPGDGTVIRF